MKHIPSFSLQVFFRDFYRVLKSPMTNSAVILGFWFQAAQAGGRDTDNINKIGYEYEIEGKSLIV